MSKDSSTGIPCNVVCGEAMNEYQVETTGARVTPLSSINVIHKYCQKLPGDKYFTPKPTFQYSRNGAFYECALTLPPTAIIQKIVGPMSRNCHSAKQLVCLEACKRLHQIGALNDYLLPYQEKSMGTSCTGKDKKNISSPGTTKRKELHGSETAHSLSGTWALQMDDIILHAYHLNFSCDVETYNDFILLTEAMLDDEVSCAKMELFLIPNKLVKVSVSQIGKVHLSSGQIRKAKLFQEFFFNGIFGKLFMGSKASGVKREFLLSPDNRQPWNTSNMYLLLPTESHLSTPNINWKGIDSCFSTVDFVNFMYGRYCSQICLFHQTLQGRTEFQKASTIHLANKSFLVQDLKDMVVFAIHTGKIYTVIDVELDRCSEDPFDSTDVKKSSDYTTYIEFFYKKYNITLQHPEQPLLLLKQSHNPHNLLIPRFKYEDNMMEKVIIPAHMPPETLVHIDVSNDIIKAFYLLPSVMHRLESLMLACQLRQNISCCPENNRIPSSLILEAITTQRCCENFSLERLELLGDSVLKYAISCHLFLRYPKMHEGQLTSLRMSEICNYRLHKAGISKNLQGYIRDSAFDPRRWVAPGQICLLPCPCSCGLDTSIVPLDDTKYVTEKTTVKIGKPCDRGHRWMCSKTISDCVEALIGTYYVGGGLISAFSLMRWFGIKCEFELVMVKEAKLNASLCNDPAEIVDDDVAALESKINYSFHVKGLLIEAVTHPSQLKRFCYQRLEFLGDSVLDLLITWHLFQSYKDIDQGELTDLRSAVVSNENFARVAVRHNLHKHLQHDSTALSEQITTYCNSLECHDNSNLDICFGEYEAPKVLGDIVESIAGAVLIDSEFHLDVIWRVFNGLLSPIVTPEKLELQPLRELIELCSSLGYFVRTTVTNRGEEAIVELAVQFNDVLLVRYARDKKRKRVKAHAALLLLKDLQERRISHSHCLSKIKHQLGEYDSSCTVKEHKSIACLSSIEPHKHIDEHPNDEISSMEKCDVKDNKPANVSIKMQKGGPRICLYELCKLLQWPMPKFEAIEQKSRVPLIFNGPSGSRAGFNSFTSTITVHIPKSTTITLQGEPQADKKSSQDSAALKVLFELQKQNKCIVK